MTSAAQKAPADFKKEMQLLVDAVLQPGQLSEATRSLSPKALQKVKATYDKFQKNDELHTTALETVVALVHYLDKKDYGPAAQQLSDVAMSSGRVLEKKLGRGWAK